MDSDRAPAPIVRRVPADLFAVDVRDLVGIAGEIALDAVAASVRGDSEGASILRLDFLAMSQELERRARAERLP